MGESAKLLLKRRVSVMTQSGDLALAQPDLELNEIPLDKSKFTMECSHIARSGPS